MLEFVKLTAAIIGISCLLGTSLGLLINLMVDPKKSFSVAAKDMPDPSLMRSIADIEKKNVIPFADVRAAIFRRRKGAVHD